MQNSCLRRGHCGYGTAPRRTADSLVGNFVTKLAALPPVERACHFDYPESWLASPVGLVHLAQLWNELPHVGRHATKVRDRLARGVCSESHRSVFEAWLATLRWVDEQFGFNESARALSKPIRLALVWSHADRIFRILRSRGLPPEWIENVFQGSDYGMVLEVVFPDAAYSEDVAAPKRLGRSVRAVGLESDSYRRSYGSNTTDDAGQEPRGHERAWTDDSCSVDTD